MVFNEHPLKDLYRLLVWWPYRGVLEQLPAGVEVQANRGLGGLLAMISAGRRRELAGILQGALGKRDDLGEIAASLFKTHLANQYVVFSFQKVTLENSDKFLEIDGLHHIDEALQKGKGVIIAHPHFALPQLPLHVLGVKGYKMNQIGGGRPDVSFSAVGEKVASIREKLESRICANLHDATGFMRPALRALADNEVLFTASDGTGSGSELGRREVVEVLGQQMNMPVFAVWAALKSGATVVPMVSYHTPDGPSLYRVEFEEPLKLRGPKEQGALVDGVNQFGARFERWLTEHPADWHFWDKWHDSDGGLLANSSDGGVK